MLNFLGIGAQKAGTTWLYEQLQHHPEVSFPSGKEIHFWDQHYNNGIESYTALFNQPFDGIQGEITPAYAMLSKSKIKEIRSINPDLKLLYLIRNPIRRAWSSALMALKRAEMDIEEASDQWFIDHFESEGSRNRGNYIQAVETWLSVFPKEQLWISSQEAIKSEPEKVIASCCAFLNIDAAVYDNQADKLNAKVHANKSQDIPEKLWEKLGDIYAEDIKALRSHPVLSKAVKF